MKISDDFGRIGMLWNPSNLILTLSNTCEDFPNA